MKDYEQLYYDALHKIKHLKLQKDQLEEELNIYKSISKNRDLKKVIVDAILKYKNQRGDINDK